MLDDHAISRSTLWRWRRRNPTCGALFRVMRRYRQLHRRMYPECWRTARDTVRQIMKLRRAGAVAPRGSENPRRPGGQSKYRREFDDQVQSSIPATASHLGVSQRTIYNWMRKHPEFGRRQTIRSVEARLPQIRRAVENLGVRRRHRRTFPTIEIRGVCQ